MRPVRHRHRLRVRKSQAVRRSPPRPTTLTIRQLTITTTTTTCLPVENKQPRSRHSSPPFTAECLGKRIRQKVEALWRDEVKKGLRFVHPPRPPGLRRADGHGTNHLPHFGVNTAFVFPADPRTLTGRTGKEVPCENLRVSRPKSAPHMTTQWGGCPEKNPLPHSRFDPGFTDLRPDFSGQPHRQTRLRDCPPAHAAHPPHGAAWESRKAPCWPRSMVGVPPPPPRPHHVNTGTKNSRTFSMSQQVRQGAGRRVSCLHARKR